MDFRGFRRALVVACLSLAAANCKKCESCVEDEKEEEEEKNAMRDHFWRVQISLVGKGRVKTFGPAFDCVSDGATQTGECGPKLVRFKEMHPPTMEATGAAGWTFEHWESQIREPDGGMATRTGPMPDGKVYLNGFGYTDTGELELVKAVFVMLAPEGGR